MLKSKVIESLLNLKDNEGIVSATIYLSGPEGRDNEEKGCNASLKIELDEDFKEIYEDEIPNIFSITEEFCELFRKEIQLDIDVTKASAIKIIEYVLIPSKNEFSVVDGCKYIVNHINFNKSREAKEIMDDFDKVIINLTNNLNKAIG